MTRWGWRMGSWSEPGALCQVVLIESLPDQRLDDRLAAHIKIVRSLIQFRQHAGSDVNVNALNRLHHVALSLEKTRNVLAPISQPGNCIGGNRFGAFTSFLHKIGSPPSSTSTA
jgi:hypothetical protein